MKNDTTLAIKENTFIKKMTQWIKFLKFNINNSITNNPLSHQERTERIKRK